MTDHPNLVMDAYAKGVNEWIASLTPDQYPIEFKILNYEPEQWSPLKSALVLKYMAWDLTGRNDEMVMDPDQGAPGRFADE